MLLNEKLQKEAANSSFSFQQVSEKPSPFSSELPLFGPKTEKKSVSSTISKKKRGRPPRNLFETPAKIAEKALSERSDKSLSRSRGKLLRQSIVEGVKFLHLREKNAQELEKIKELEQEVELTQEKVLPHLLENKTRNKRKFKELREEFKKKKGFKAEYKTLRGSSLQKMKGILNQETGSLKRTVEESVNK